MTKESQHSYLISIAITGRFYDISLFPLVWVVQTQTIVYLEFSLDIKDSKINSLKLKPLPNLNLNPNSNILNLDTHTNLPYQSRYNKVKKKPHKLSRKTA